MRLISVKTKDIAMNILNVLSKDNIQTGYVFKGLKGVPLTQYWQNKELRDRLWYETEGILGI